MRLTRKIVSTPLKWAAKQILNHTLLTFPEENSPSPLACHYCPEMCRFSCPTAVVSGNDAVTPCNKMSFLYQEETWPNQASQGQALWPIYDCTGCGRCTEYCVYQVPVAKTLFEARKKYAWPKAQEALKGIPEALDPVGDLADELGNVDLSTKRLARWRDSGAIEVSEPKIQWYLDERKIPSKLLWEEKLLQLQGSDLNQAARALSPLLGKKRWLFHESVWMSRIQRRADRILNWMNGLRSNGISIELPYQSGIDCVDCGGEGAYAFLFPEQARQMCEEIWDAGEGRYDGIVCVSHRCAEHFRISCRAPVYSFLDLYQAVRSI